jgi:hypothetical protein
MYERVEALKPEAANKLFFEHQFNDGMCKMSE